MPLCKLVPIEHHFFIGPNVRSNWPTALAAVNAILHPFLGARVIPPRAVAVGNRDVGLLYMAQHLLVKRFPQARQWRHHRVGVSILGFEVRSHIGVFLVAQPSVVVGEQHSVHLRFGMDFAGDGRCG